MFYSFKENDEIIINCHNHAYLSRIVHFCDDFLIFEIIEKKDLLTEFNFEVTLIQGYAKGDKMDFIAQKATELGVNFILPCLMKRSIVKLDEAKRIQKKERMQKICKEASEQSERMIVPEVLGITELKNINFDLYDIKILAYEEEGRKNTSNLKEEIRKIKDNDKVAIIIGPEGGFAPEEISFLVEKGFVKVALGPRILRTETAGLYALSAISYEKELCL